MLPSLPRLVPPRPPLQASGRNQDDSSRYCHIPSSLEQQLMPFQREGVKFALRHGGRALIGDEMGLGKVLCSTVGSTAAVQQQYGGTDVVARTAPAGAAGGSSGAAD